MTTRRRFVTDWRSVERHGLNRTKDRATGAFPAAWLSRIDAEAKTAPRPEYARALHRFAPSELAVWTHWLDEFGGAAYADMSDAEICVQADRIASLAQFCRIGEPGQALVGARRGVPSAAGPTCGLHFAQAENDPRAAIEEFCCERGVEPPDVDKFGLTGAARRVRCPLWWRRALRRMIARKCERGALTLGIVSKPNRQPYASNSAVWRRIWQNERNAEAMRATLMENDEGLRRSLAELAATSTSNKAIRRGELMTRIRGCEAIADECGNPGLFLTLTCPSRFHSTLRTGERNPRHDGSTPRDAQLWLRETWARTRAALARHRFVDLSRVAPDFVGPIPLTRGASPFGFRVAEPHHDGCTHWHALFWFSTAGALSEALSIIRGYWLSDAGDEPGAQKYRINAKRMERGGAAGYVAKYVAKNIDDHTITEHIDDYADSSIGPDLLGDAEVKPSMRVEAWASTWGIRQFQAIGQPPVTVWRELRRIREEEARRAGPNGIVHRAWLAAQKFGDVLADWARYVRAQGGMLLGRRFNVVMSTEVQEIEGRYGRVARPLPLGVKLNLGCARTVWSERRLWRAVRSGSGDSVSRGASAAPRTRVNNCTAAPIVDDDAAALRADFLRGAGGKTGDSPPCNVDNFWKSNAPPRRAHPMTA